MGEVGSNEMGKDGPMVRLSHVGPSFPMLLILYCKVKLSH